MRKWLTLALCLAMIGMMTVNGTFALSDNGVFKTLTEVIGKLKPEPEQDENVFKVTLFAQERDANGNLKAISGMPHLMPAHYSDNFAWNATENHTVAGANYMLWSEASVTGAEDRFTSVKNDSQTSAEDPNAAYFRIAFALQAEAMDVIHLNFNENSSDYIWTNGWTPIKIGGRNFYMKVATYQKRLAAGDVSAPALLQIAMDKTADSAQIAKLDNDFLQIQAMGIDADGFIKTVGNEAVVMTAIEALDAAMPLATLNPFN